MWHHLETYIFTQAETGRNAGAPFAKAASESGRNSDKLAILKGKILSLYARCRRHPVADGEVAYETDPRSGAPQETPRLRKTIRGILRLPTVTAASKTRR